MMGGRSPREEGAAEGRASPIPLHPDEAGTRGRMCPSTRARNTHGHATAGELAMTM